MEGCLAMIGKVVNYNGKAGMIIPTIIFVGVPVVSLIRVHGNCLWSLAVMVLFKLGHHDSATAKVEQVKEDDDLELECVVCLCQVSRGEIYRLLPNCNHSFHVHCIDSWLQAHSTCPLCRTHVPPNYYHNQQQHFYDGLISYFLSAFEIFCKWIMDNPANFELVSALCENSNYLS
uniref:RING-type domain-containing protein n=1 Tax=Davidia involucrata TaxID=16924 RepID=A0A5B7BPM3_DAVIN